MGDAEEENGNAAEMLIADAEPNVLSDTDNGFVDFYTCSPLFSIFEMVVTLIRGKANDPNLDSRKEDYYCCCQNCFIFYI